ncbi:MULTISPECIES: murein transglycosylase A [unclassified Synechocystis]|uniref:murein transglycosylase A n=1 Tax=unclassified Synechocystis TaxID=2640012 RepID=UPI000425E956|nr:MULTISPECIES: murein transglycosylase A [unclassified Synechocystis]AIE73115.1 Membrane-bound lytic murein transglycosylase A precursor [Synechocystis sp. PCC 6714]MCT0254362.1 murein transglycosylase A [Synechocystis sp. CS-94]
MIKQSFPLLALLLVFGINAPILRAQSRPLMPVSGTNLAPQVGFDEQLWGNHCSAGDKQSLLRAIDHSLAYLKTASAARAYQNYPVPGVTRERVARSLQRFRTLLQQSPNPEALQAAVTREFQFYQAIGTDGQGTVHFTGYFEPVYTASRQPTEEYRYPIYGLPTNFSRWSKPHPTRVELEGIDGRGKSSQLRGREIAWFRNRLDAYLIQVQGSAKINWVGGGQSSIAFAGATDYPYVSLGRETIAEGIFQPGEVTLPRLIEYFEQNPAEMSRFIPRNNRMIFFKEAAASTPAKGSIGVPVTAERSIATDKSLMPPGAIAVLAAPVPDCRGEKVDVSRFVMDQDTGSAIKGPGRVDIFMGTGQVPGDRAGLMSDNGKMYYLLLRQ